MVTQSPGSRDSPPEQDFVEEGTAKNTGAELDTLIEAVLMRLVQVRMEHQKDVLADEEEAEWIEKMASLEAEGPGFPGVTGSLVRRTRWQPKNSISKL